jgi:PAS domain S-box-containing protein
LADELNLSNLHLEEIVNVRTQSLQLANKELTKLSMVADKAANGVIIVTPGGIIEWVNTGFSELLGYKLDDLSRLFNLNIHNIDRVGDFKAAFDYTVQNGVIMLHDGYFFHIGGDKVWLQTTMSPVTNELGVVTHVVGIMADIRRLKNAESEISQQKQELESQRDNLIAQRDQILIQNKRITASLTYARNIQNAILPAREYMEELFSELCIVNMPKDIVSGDFYWAIRRGHQIIVAVADCTGHGVPGAFMSMLGVTLLKQVCLEDSNNNNTTGQILSSLRNYLKRALRQTEQSVTSRDGMDMSLCVIDEKEKTLQFSGAYNSLIFANKNGVEVIKGDKMPVGIFRKEKPVFETHTRNYKEGDAIYLFTDGYVDQFYLDTFEKYGSRRLVATIEAFDGMSMKVQERQFLKNYFDWRGNFQQIDDVLLLGARL